MPFSYVNTAAAGGKGARLARKAPSLAPSMDIQLYGTSSLYVWYQFSVTAVMSLILTDFSVRLLR